MCSGFPRLELSQSGTRAVKLIDDSESSEKTDRHDLTAGRWDDTGFQRQGWRFREVQNLGAHPRLCDMCAVVKVHFAHVYEHEEVPGLLYVGLKCSEVLEGDFYRPEKRERDFRTDLRIEHDWFKANWRLSRIGNHYVNTRGFNITIWDKGRAGFGLTIKLQNKFDGSYELNGKKLYSSLEAAKEGALVALLHARRDFRATDRVERIKPPAK